MLAFSVKHILKSDFESNNEVYKCKQDWKEFRSISTGLTQKL